MRTDEELRRQISKLGSYHVNRQLGTVCFEVTFEGVTEVRRTQSEAHRRLFMKIKKKQV